MASHSEQAMLATPQAPAHAHPQHGTQAGFNAFPSFQDIAAGLAAAGESLPQSLLAVSLIFGLDPHVAAICHEHR